MIVPSLAKLIVREHLYKPITGRVLTLGRQTIAMNLEQSVRIMEAEDMSFNRPMVTNDAIITDKTFFSLMGINELDSMDISGHEGATIIHDLNYPVPERLYEQYDFIIDGGTFDHLFDLRTAFENVVSMLKPNGRILQWNAASNFVGESYLSFSPDLFYDYYIQNEFLDCVVYVAELDFIDQKESWDLYIYDPDKTKHQFHTEKYLVVMVLAEKGHNSTYFKMPIQKQYNSYTHQKRESKRVPFKKQDGEHMGYMHVGYI